MNYRSVVILGQLVEVTDTEERIAALDAIVEHIVPGRLSEARGPNRKELKATMLVKIRISETSAKIRTPPLKMKMKIMIYPSGPVKSLSPYNQGTRSQIRF